MFQRSQYIDPNSAAKANSWYIRVNQKGAQPNYFNKIISSLAQKSAQDTSQNTEFPVELVDSANDYKMTAIRTADCWFPEAFVAWHDCLKAYKDEIRAGQDVSQLHVYSAERNAVRYELEAMQRFPRERGDYRPFHPRVVMLMDNEKRLKQFMICWIFGFIDRVSDGDKFYWELNLSKGEPLQLTRSQAKEPSDILFRIMNNFVLIGKDMKAGSWLSISEKAVSEAISKKRNDLGLEKLIKKIEYHLTPPSGAEISDEATEILNTLIPFVPWLEAKAKTSIEERGASDELVSEQPEYWDLATVARLIFTDEIEADKKRFASNQ